MDQAIDLLTSHSREDAITTKLIQPPWFRASEILLYCLFIISAVTAALKLQFDTFSCNVVECIYNETLTTIQTCPRFQTRSLDADATYNFIDDKCRDQMIPFVLENIPFIYFIIATILLSCSSLWLKLPSSALYIERFVGFVKECNEAIETHGSVYWEYVSDTSLPAYRQQNRVVQFLITCFCCRNRVTPNENEDIVDNRAVDNVREKSSSTGSCQNVSDLEPIQKLSKLHDKFVHMVKPQKRKIHVCVILILQQVLLTGLSLVFFLCVSCTFFWFDFLRNEYICVLEEYSRIACHYRLYATYYFFAVIFCFCNCFHCFLSCVHLCWVIRHSFTPIDISRDPKGPKRYVSGQLGLMLHLLTTNDTYFVSRVQFFMNDKTKAPVTYEEKELMYSEVNLERINNKKGQLRLQKLPFRPRSFDSLHRIPNLTVLCLTRCELTEFPFCILLSKSLMKVDLSNNGIQIIPRLTGEVKDRTALNSLVLDKNPLLPISMRNLGTWTKLKSLSIVNAMYKNELQFSLKCLHTQAFEGLEIVIGELKGDQEHDQHFLSNLTNGDLQSGVFLTMRNKKAVMKSILNFTKALRREDPNAKTSLLKSLGSLKKAIKQNEDDQSIFDKLECLNVSTAHMKQLKEVTDAINANYRRPIRALGYYTNTNRTHT